MDEFAPQVGVGALVLNETDEILLVQERRGPAARPGFWKMPTGLVDVGEAVGAAAVREVAEETGVSARLESIVSFREVHGVGMAGKSDLFFVCACRALSTDIRIQESEIADAKVCENRAVYTSYSTDDVYLQLRGMRLPLLAAWGGVAVDAAGRVLPLGLHVKRLAVLPNGGVGCSGVWPNNVRSVCSLPCPRFLRKLPWLSSHGRGIGWGMQSLRGQYAGLIGEELPVGFRPGHNMVYHQRSWTDPSLASSQQRPAL